MVFQHPGLSDLPAAFTIRQALNAGISRQQERRLLSAGALRSPHHGVRLQGVSTELADRAAAAGLLLPAGAAFSRRTAAELFGFDPRSPVERGQSLPLECTVPTDRTSLRQRGIRCFSASLPAEDLVEIDGLPLTCPDRTAADLLRWLPAFMALALVDAMAHAGVVSPEAVGDILARYAGDRHVAKARRLLASVEPKVESYGESWQRLRLLDAGFPAPEVQIPIEDSRGREIYRLDMGYRELKIGLEYDGMEFHDEAGQRTHDEIRREDLRKRFGWNVIGCGRGDILGRSMAFELAVGDLLGLSPAIYQRMW